MNINDEIIREILSKKKGYALLHLEEIFWKSIITEALKLTGCHRSNAAELLGMSRQTFSGRMAMYGIDARTVKADLDCELRLKIISSLQNSSNEEQAAKMVGVTRTNLRYHMKRLGINRYSGYA
ncbi:MAG: hypothetical protein [Caudoviricetes sp.]|nr:MAG: hypothetical protein [Caudoviricetes sp.]